jgi:hypothetical protein
LTLLDFIEIAGRAIVTNALRSALTTLGIVIGVASVIVMGAVGAGARSEVDRQISSLGTQVLVINPSARVYGGRSSGAGTNLPLSEDDLAALETKVPGVVAISGQLWASAMVVRGKANQDSFTLAGERINIGRKQELTDAVERVIRRAGQRYRSARGADGPIGGQGPVRRQRPDRSDLSCQEHALHGDRRAELEGQEHDRRRP